MTPAGGSRRGAGTGATGEVVVLAGVAAASAVGAWLWATGEIAGWLSSGHWPSVPATAALGIASRLPAHLGNPRLAWPGAVRGSLSGAPLIDGCAVALLVVAVAVGLLACRVRRRFGAAPRSRASTGARWARRSDLRALRVRIRSRGHSTGLVLGRLPGVFGALVATEARHSVLVVGPTQSGKTTGLAIPAILEWGGPMIATSVKDDIAAVTVPWRSGQGPCWVFDPTGSTASNRCARWSPLSVSTDWSSAQRVASWMVDATPARAGMTDAAFWYAAAAKQLAPLLLAAQRAGMTMAEVVRWTNLGSVNEAMQVLDLSGEDDASMALAACDARDERIRSSVTTTLETVLSPFEDPVVAAWTSGTDVDLDRLLAGSGSLYLCGPSHEQHRVQGLFATLVSSVVAATFRRGPLDPPMLLVLDEAANIAPIRDLDTLASTGAGLGIQIVTVCQDLAQLASRYGPERARTIANNHRAKLVLSGVSDLATLDLVSGLAGEHAVREDNFTHDLRDGRRTRSSAVAYRRLAPSDELRRTPPGQGVLVYGHLPPARVTLRPWYEDRRLRGRAGGGGGRGGS